MSDKAIRECIKRILYEDTGKGDITALSVIARDVVSDAAIISEGSGVLAGLDISVDIFKAVDAKLRLKIRAKDGRKISKNSRVLYIKGKARSILKAERTVLNILSRLSGIATLTSAYVGKALPYKAKIMDTRKTTPGLRALEKYAVKMGGGHNHRMGLYDMVLIKDNHLSVISDRLLINRERAVYEAVMMAKRRRGVKVEVEVNNLPEFKAALKAGPDIIMLDNMSVKEIGKAVLLRAQSAARPAEPKGAGEHRVQKRPLLEVSGGVTLNRIRRIAKTGVDRISIGALTSSAKPLSFRLDIIR